MSTKRKRKYGVVRKGAETSAGTNDDVFDRFFPKVAAPTPTREVPPTIEVPDTRQVAPTRKVSATPEAAHPLPPISDTVAVSPTPAVAGFWTISNDVTDSLWKAIRDPYAQSVLVQLLRLSWGYHRDECVVGLPKLADRCGFHKNQARKGKRILINLGIIAEAGEDNTNGQKELRGTRFKILLKRPPTGKVSPTAAVPNKLNTSKEQSKKPSVCDRCEQTGGFLYVDPDDKSKGVRKCPHE